ncbi:BRO-E [Betabaculovirus altermyunipunctae]|uniref:BRO-E n=1 Tax=Betabaculovirus altermyunipunctae TaxID=3051996 RepID=A0A1S5YE04_9BBAC|nr:BRO-E [Betabaculovirus altermyunipunctae]AQQ80371.1 BRO-E [Betabaculovirus altermyunipunctae]
MAPRKQVIHFQNEPVDIVYMDKTGPDGLRYYFFDIVPIARLMSLEHPLSKIDPHHVIEEPIDWSRTNSRTTTLVSEAGLYQLLFSGKPVSVRQGMVRNWLFDVVLPAVKMYTDNNPEANYSQQHFEHLSLKGVSVPSCVSNDILGVFKQTVEILERQLKQKDMQLERLIRIHDEQLMRKDEQLVLRERELEIKTDQLNSNAKQLKNTMAILDLKEGQMSEVIAITKKKDAQLEQQFNQLVTLMGKQAKICVDESDEELPLPQNHDTVLMIVRENSTTFKGIAAKRRYVDQQKQKLRYNESMIVVHSKRPDPKRDWNAAMDMVEEIGAKERCQILPNLKRVRFEQVKDADTFERGLKKMFNVNEGF